MHAPAPVSFTIRIAGMKQTIYTLQSGTDDASSGLSCQDVGAEDAFDLGYVTQQFLHGTLQRGSFR